MLRLTTAALAVFFSTQVLGDISVTGTLKKWHPVTVDNTAATAVLSEALVEPNPFLDFRYNVIFTSPTGNEYTVPGYFAGDGNGNGIGSVWRAKFSADETGEWHYRVSFQRGDDISVSDVEGLAMPSDGETGSFSITDNSPDDPGFLAQGRLQYTGEHYLKFADGPYWIKGGVDSPENFFGYAGFDNTYDQDTGANTGVLFKGLHHYVPHIADWREGDPLFTNSANPDGAKGIIGAINYLASEGVNSMYFLPMNLGGDGQDTFPFVGHRNNSYDKTHYDISKMFQWQIVMEHMQRQGVAVHLVLAEQESQNTDWLDDGELGIQRKLFYREMIARFAYLLAIKWNISEESRYDERRHKEFAGHIRSLDWANHTIAIHTDKDRPEENYNPLLGDQNFTATSIQFSPVNAGEFVEEWRRKSADAGWPWVIDMDEVGTAAAGLSPATTERLRKLVLYPVYFGGGNIEWYFGYHPLPLGGDLRTEDFRTREEMYRYMRYARELMQSELPFWTMEPSDELYTGSNDAEVFAQDGVAYAVYLPEAATTGSINVMPNDYTLRWFNPRSGQFEGKTVTVSATDSVELGDAPSNPAEDWVAIVKVVTDEPDIQDNSSDAQPVDIETDQTTGDEDNRTGSEQLPATEDTTSVSSSGGGSLTVGFLCALLLLLLFNAYSTGATRQIPHKIARPVT